MMTTGTEVDRNVMSLRRSARSIAVRIADREGRVLEIFPALALSMPRQRQKDCRRRTAAQGSPYDPRRIHWKM